MDQGASGESGRAERLTSFEEVYREIAINCFRFLDFRSFGEVDRLTIPQYEVMMQAVHLRQIDLDYRNHMQAYLNFVVKAEKKAGKNKTTPVYRNFKKFYDYEKALNKAFGVTSPNKSRFAGIGKLLKRKEGEENG